MEVKKKILILGAISLLIGVGILPSVNAGPPWIGIGKPCDGYLYLHNKAIARIGFTIIIGAITIDAATYDGSDSGDGNVTFYIDNVARYTYPKYDGCSWTWNERGFGYHTIKVIANTPEGEIGGEEITVFMINFW